MRIPAKTASSIIPLCCVAIAMTAAAAGGQESDRTRAGEFLKRADADGDGKVTKAEFVATRTADAEGYAQVAKLFRAASVAEATHEFTHMGAIMNLGGKVENSALDAVEPGTTLANLKQVVTGESYERDTMYPGYLKLAEAEQAHEAVRSFGFAMAVEKQHAVLFTAALAQLGKNPPVDYFVCPICGTTTLGAPAKGKCPTCRNPTAKYVNIL